MKDANNQEAKNLNPKKLSVAVARAGESGFSIDTSGDHELMENQTYSWDDLIELKESLGNGLLEFVGQVNAMIQNPTIIANLGDQKNHFYQTVQIFFTDVQAFSEKIRVNRELHENKRGPVSDLSQLSLYNRVAMTYHALCQELTILVGPTISELILISAKVNQNIQNQVNEENAQ